MDADETTRELGAYAHDPSAAEAADRFADQIGSGTATTGTARGRA